MTKGKFVKAISDLWLKAIETQWSAEYVHRRLYVLTVVSDGSVQIENQDVTLGFANDCIGAHKIIAMHERRKPYLDRNEICATLDWEGFVTFPMLWGMEADGSPVERTVLCCWDTSDAIWQVDWRGATCLTPDDFYDWLDKDTNLHGDYCNLA